MKHIRHIIGAGLAAVICAACASVSGESTKTPVDYVNPYMGNISHLLVPTFPTVHLPNSMLRVYPERADYTADRIKGLPVVVTNHREKSAFNLTPYQGAREALAPVLSYSYDQEVIKPYYYSVTLDEPGIDVEYAPSHQSGIYKLKMNGDAPGYLILNSKDGEMTVDGNTVKGYQKIDDRTRIYLYLETARQPVETMVLADGVTDSTRCHAEGRDACVVLYYGDNAPELDVRYGVSLISPEQAQANLRREIKDYDLQAVAATGRDVWNKALGTMAVEGGAGDDEKTVFYTSLYRVFERPICLSEDGKYFSAFDGQIHDDEGSPFYTDDWIWDTYRAAHPMRVLIDPATETNIIRSYLRMACQMDSLWMPTFPEINGDSRRMNSNHGVATIADACAKGLTDFDVELAYDACRKGIEEKTLAPWSHVPAAYLNKFWDEHGYIPAIGMDEEETLDEVHHFEKRQPIAVTLGTSYDDWCLSQIASYLGKKDDADKYLRKSYNYRNVFNPETRFFHPKDKDGKFIEPFDYSFPGGMGSREFYGENNGWVYRWDVPHNVADLVSLMGGRKQFADELDRMFNEPLGRSKYAFFAKLPDHTGNVGQFSMANEPSLHIPYLYNYAGRPWMTQKRVRMLLNQWFRNDLMGIPGDEDGGGMSSFVVFSMLGFYPVTPGSPTYNIGSPMFEHATVTLGNGKKFEIKAHNASAENKYIQSARLNGRELNQPWFDHKDIAEGGVLELEMGPRANKNWGVAEDAVPPSAAKI